MELKAEFYYNFYRKLYDVLYTRELKKTPPYTNGEPGSIIWTKKFKINNEEVYLANFYFEVSIKYYYDIYRDARDGKDVSIDRIPYFTALLYLDAKEKKYSKLNFTDLFIANRKEIEVNKFSKNYSPRILDELHSLFAEENLSEDYTDEIIERRNSNKQLSVRKDNNLILEILHKDPLEISNIKIKNEDISVLFDFACNLSNSLEKRKFILSLLIKKKLLSEDNINCLLFFPQKEFLDFVISLLYEITLSLPISYDYYRMLSRGIDIIIDYPNLTSHFFYNAIIIDPFNAIVKIALNAEYFEMKKNLFSIVVNMNSALSRVPSISRGLKNFDLLVNLFKKVLSVFNASNNQPVLLEGTKRVLIECHKDVYMACEELFSTIENKNYSDADFEIAYSRYDCFDVSKKIDLL